MDKTQLTFSIGGGNRSTVIDMVVGRRADAAPAVVPASLLAREECGCTRADCVRSQVTRPDFARWWSAVCERLPLDRLVGETSPGPDDRPGWRSCRDVLGGAGDVGLVADHGAGFDRGTFETRTRDTAISPALLLALKDGLDDLEVACAALGLIADAPLPPRLRQWTASYVATLARYIRPVEAVEAQQGIGRVIRRRLADWKWIMGLAWLSTSNPGIFELIVLSFVEAGGTTAQVAALRRAAHAEAHRLRRHLPRAPGEPDAAPAGDRGMAERALRWMIAWAREHRQEFFDLTSDGDRIGGTWSGRWDRDGWLGVAPGPMHAVLERGGFDPAAAIRSWDAQGWLMHDPAGKPSHQARIAGRRVWLVSLKRWAVEACSDDRDGALSDGAA